MGNSAKLEISTFANRSICQRIATQQRIWLTSIDLGSEGIDDNGNLERYRYIPYTKCIKGIDKSNANYSLKINTYGMNKNSRTRPVVMDSDSPINFNTLYFKDLSKCNLAKSQLDRWFRSLKKSFFGKYDKGHFLAASTKCFSQT